MSEDFRNTELGHVGKRVLRMGLAGNYGIDASDALWAAEQGVNYWLWGLGFRKMTPAIQQLVAQERERHVIAMLGYGLLGWQVRKSVERALRKLNTDYLDVFKLGWLGRTSRFSPGIVETLVKLREEGKIRAIGISIHDRERAGKLAADSEIDLFMIRYSAKHPGAEHDIFPHLEHRNPDVVAYTALAWAQLIREVKGIDMPPLTPEQCYRFVLSNPHVHLVLTGPKNREQLASNLKALEQGPLDDEEMAHVRAYGKAIKAKRKLDYVR